MSVPAVLPPHAAASFRELADALPGPVHLALVPLAGGPATLLGGDAAPHGWSTTKVPVLVALMRARGAAGLTPAERGRAHAAITKSDNEAILELSGQLEEIQGGLLEASDYLQQMFRFVGDRRTVVATAPPPPGAATTVGQTRWAPSEAVKFFRALALGDLLPAAETAYVLGLMQNVIPSQSWGLGSGGFTVPVAFKGGWGPLPSGSHEVLQSGIVDPQSPNGIAVSMVAYPPCEESPFDVGTQMLTRTAHWLRIEFAHTRGPGL